MTINEARDFLNNIIEDKSQELGTKELALKLILVIGVMRGNVEDFAIALNLIEKYQFEFDISEEIGRINFDIEETALNPKFFEEIEKVKSDGILFYLQNLIASDKVMKKNFGFACDGEYFYIHYKGLGLLKIGTGENESMLGKVYLHKSYYRVEEKCKLLYLNGKLLVRSSKEKKKILIIVDPVTLDETKEVISSEKNSPKTLEWKDDKENNRFMGVTPLFTDSNYLYVVSLKKPEKGKLD